MAAKDNDGNTKHVTFSINTRTLTIVLAGAGAITVVILGFLYFSMTQEQLEKISLEKRELENNAIEAAEQQKKLEMEKQELEKEAIEAADQQQKLEIENSKKTEQINAQMQAKIDAEEKARLELQRIESEAKLKEMLLGIENEKKSILVNYAWSPFIMGLTDDELTFYVQPLPSYASQDVRNQVETLASWMDGKTMYGGIKLKRVYQEGIDDFSVNWVKDYQEEAIGRQVGKYLIVGLGMNNCYGEWRPFTGYTIYKIMWHEVGHALGYDHVSDPTNILYEGGTGIKFDLEFAKTITLPDGYYRSIPFCNGGSYFFTTNSDDQYSGYKVYVVPPNIDPEEIISGKVPYYVSCSAYENEMTSFSQNCSVDKGSYLMIHNPTTLGFGSAINVDVKTYDRNPDNTPNFDFDESHMYFTQDVIDHVWTLFHS